MSLGKKWALGLCLYFLLPCLAAGAKEPERKTKPEAPPARFLRVSQDEDQSPRALEVAIVRFERPAGKRPPVTVDLVGAVHVADADFFSALNERFKHYDAVLYELVAPEGTKVSRESAGNGSPVSAIQNGMTGLLELQFQLKGIDYNQDNMVHADMSPEQFAQSMRDRGESILGIIVRTMGYSLAQQSKGAGGATDAQLMLALLSKNRAMALKRILAQQFEDLEGSVNVLNGEHGSTLITERNKVALEVLREQIAAGKRKLAIFYGAGHLPDFEKRLREDFQLVPKKTTWLVAWDLTDKPSGKNADR